MRILLAILPAVLVCACTMTPSDFPQCVDPNAPRCPPHEAGADADASETAVIDSPHEGADRMDVGIE